MLETNYNQYIYPENSKTFEVNIKERNKPDISLKWTNQNTRSSAGRPPAAQIRGASVKPSAEAKKAKSPTDCWKVFFTSAIISLIVSRTNKRIETWRSTVVEADLVNIKRRHNIDFVDQEELECFIGIFYIRGLYKMQVLYKSNIYFCETSCNYI